MRLSGKVAIVTGAATGIGRAIAAAMVAEGASVTVDYVGSAGTAQAVVAELVQAGGKAIALAADVSKPEEASRLVEETVQAFGGLDIFVNNAGIEYRYDFLETPPEAWFKTIAVDLGGPFFCSQAAARQLVKQGRGGRIINISSVHEELAFLQHAPYAAAKGGLKMLTRTIAVELAEHKITVNNICPGAVSTPIDNDVQSNPALNAKLMAEIPLARWGKPEEVAELAVYLASDAAGYITGSSVFIDGGMLRQAGNL